MMLHSYPNARLLHSFPCDAGRARKVSHLKYKKERMPCLVSSKYSKVETQFHSFGEFCEGGKLSFNVQPHLRIGFIGFEAPLRTLCHGVLARGVSMSSPRYGAYVKRFFSQAPRPIVLDQSDAGVKNGHNFYASSQSEKRGNHARALAAQRKKNVSCSGSLASEENYILTSNGALLGHQEMKTELDTAGSTLIASENPNSNTKGKTKKPSRVKKRRDQSSISNTSVEASDSNGSVSTSKTKNSANVKSKKSSKRTSKVRLIFRVIRTHYFIRLVEVI